MGKVQPVLQGIPIATRGSQLKPGEAHSDISVVYVWGSFGIPAPIIVNGYALRLWAAKPTKGEGHIHLIV